VGSCEHGNEPSRFRKVVKIIDQLCDCQLEPLRSALRGPVSASASSQERSWLLGGGLLCWLHSGAYTRRTGSSQPRTAEVKLRAALSVCRQE
jgi:hypothetical protein